MRKGRNGSKQGHATRNSFSSIKKTLRLLGEKKQRKGQKGSGLKGEKKKEKVRQGKSQLSTLRQKKKFKRRMKGRWQPLDSQDDQKRDDKWGAERNEGKKKRQETTGEKRPKKTSLGKKIAVKKINTTKEGKRTLKRQERGGKMAKRKVGRRASEKQVFGNPVSTLA